MSNDLFQVISWLTQQLSNFSNNSDQIQKSFSWHKDIEPLAWLKEQKLYPKCYWQSRDAKEEVISLGKVKSFTDVKSAELSLNQKQRIWGGCAFEQNTKVLQENKQIENKQNYFFLPLIELSRIDQKWTLTLNIPADKKIIQQALDCLVFDFELTKSAIDSIEICEKKHLPDYFQWKQMVDSALDDITHTELEKVVLARKTSLTLSGELCATEFLQTSRQLNQDNFHFLLEIDEQQSFVGSTPERLFLKKGESIETEALAGTIGRGDNLDKDNELATWLLNDKKNNIENQLVVDDIQDRLSSLFRLTISPKASVIKLRKVQHLIRKIKGEIICSQSETQISNYTLLGLLQPTAAVAGFPRKKALDYILQKEPFARTWYAGSIGFMSKAKTEFCVAIRSALISQNKVDLFAGAGIVLGSNAEFEWEELNRKVSTLLGLIESNPTTEIKTA